LSNLNGTSGSVSQVADVIVGNTWFGWNLSYFEGERANLTISNFTVSSVPEPSTLLLLGSGLAGLGIVMRRIKS
jgi:hypothetical protein